MDFTLEHRPAFVVIGKCGQGGFDDIPGGCRRFGKRPTEILPRSNAWSSATSADNRWRYGAP